MFCLTTPILESYLFIYFFAKTHGTVGERTINAFFKGKPRVENAESLS